MQTYHLAAMLLGLAFAFLIGVRLGIRLVHHLLRAHEIPAPPLDLRLLRRANLKRLLVEFILVLPFGHRLLYPVRLAYAKVKFFLQSFNPLFRNLSKAEDYLRLGDMLMREGLLDFAVEQFTQAVELAPCSVRGYLYRGRALQQVGRPKDAYKDFQMALALNSGTADEKRMLHASLSSLLVELQEIDQALYHFYTHLLLVRTGQAEGQRFRPGAVPKGAEKLQILIEAHDSLAEDVINFQGDFDAALSIYGRKQELQQRFARTFRLDADRVLYLPDDWVRNIGHMALLDFWVKMRDLGWRPWQNLVLLAPPNATANRSYLDYWKRYYTVVTDPYLIRALLPFASALGNRVASVLRLPDGQEKYFCEGMGVIQEQWEAQGNKSLLELTEADRERGRQGLARLGVPEGAWYVCLHVRAPGFHKEGEGLHQSHRNANIHSYLPAIRSIIARGGFVIRLGDASMEPLPPLPGLIDYAHSSHKSPALDVFLCASCQFFIGVASGLSHVPTTFGVPCVLTNWVSNAFPVYSGRDLFIPKLTWTDAEDRLLSFTEALEPGIRKLSYCGLKLLERDLRAVDNTPEEIQELVEEMFEVLEGHAAYTDADEHMQRVFRHVALGYGLVGFSRLGRAFLRKYAHLLPHDRLQPIAA
jgi:putative glycosyltransferase (TIGR04372 family)